MTARGCNVISRMNGVAPRVALPALVLVLEPAELAQHPGSERSQPGQDDEAHIDEHRQQNSAQDGVGDSY